MRSTSRLLRAALLLALIPLAAGAGCVSEEDEYTDGLYGGTRRLPPRGTGTWRAGQPPQAPRLPVRRVRGTRVDP